MLSRLIIFATWICSTSSLGVSAHEFPRGASVQTVLKASDSPVASDIPLHILPLGDSITEGARSSDGNGYRFFLQSLLHHDDVTFLGSLHTGNMTNNAHEGHGGFTIAQIMLAFREYSGATPNVLLLHAGTNDVNKDEHESKETLLQRLGLLIDEIVSAYPKVTVIVAKIVQSVYEGTRERIAEFDSEVPTVVKVRAEAGYKVLVADMSSIGADDKDLADGLHPDDVGYEKMARVWYGALREAASKGWISSTDELVTRS